MEFEMDRIQMSGFDAVLDVTLRPEETIEMIVPDACPDILRVVDTDGVVLLGRKEAADGRAELSGTIKASVLYQPDGEVGMRHLEVSIPFTCGAEGAGVGAMCTVVASVRLCHADTRALNPRKVLVRAEAAIDVTVFSPRAISVCSQVTQPANGDVQQLTETRELYWTAWVQEKPLPISETVALSVGRPAAAELLKHRISVSGGESKLIGNKLIVKGSAELFLLYRGEDNGLYTCSAELPFSQIMEVSGVAEEADCLLIPAITGAECVLTPTGEGREVSVSLEVMTQAVVRELRPITVLIDAYSTAEPLACEWETTGMDQKLDRGVRSQNTRELWELPMSLREITECHVAVGQVLQRREGERLILSAQVVVHTLAVDESGDVISIQHPTEVNCPLELPETGRCFCRCESVGDVYATPSSGGLEVRFSLDFQYTALARGQLTTLAALRPGEAAQETGQQPSLVLRMFEGKERLWDVAKTYGTTIADIISANELESEAGAVGKLLLIPRRR